MTTIVGMLAVVITAAMLPSQARHVLRNRNSPDHLRGVSLISAAIISSTSVIWAAYGFRFDAVAVSVTALIDLTFQALIVGVVWRVFRPSVAVVSGVVVGAVVVLGVALVAPQAVLGVIGAGTSMAMFAPQAVRVVRARGTVAGAGFSPLAAGLLIVGNSTWLIYGILLEDIWVILPCPFSVTSGVLILWAWWGSRVALGPGTGTVSVHREITEEVPR